VEKEGERPDMKSFGESEDPKLEKVVDLLFRILKTNEKHFKYKMYYLLFSYVMHLRECSKCRTESGVSEELLEEFYSAYRDAGVEIELGTITHPPKDRRRRKK
jgi:hypothetical protein